MVDKLSLYNGALTVLGLEKLSTLTDTIEPRYKLDDVWDNDLRNRVLQMGQWNFATRSVQLDSSTSTTPTFGYQFAFDKATDFIRTTAVCRDPYFDIPLVRYTDEAAWWFADVDPIYVRYISNDNQYGFDYSIWPKNFTEFVEYYMAFKVAPRLKGSYDDDKLEKRKEKMLLRAKSTDAMEDPARFAPIGTWADSRQGRWGGNRDRGSRRRLIG